MRLTEIPLDVILVLTYFLDLHDSVHLLVTCSSFKALFSLKDFWFKSLDRIQTVHLQLLPCPVGVNIFNMPIDALRKLAIHAYSLKRNWSSERALPVSVNTLALGAECRDICVIHGTNMVVTNSPEQLVCWDTQSGVCLAAIEDEDDTAGCQQSPPFHLPGQSLIGFLCASYDGDLSLLVLKIDYQDRDSVTISRIYSNSLSGTAFQPTWYPASGAALDDKTIGLIISNRDDKLSMLAYCHFDDTAVHFVPLGMRLGPEPKCALVKGYFYISGQEQRDGPATVLRVCIDRSSTSITHDVERITVQVPSSISGKSTILGKARMVPTTSGATLISTRSHPRFPDSALDICSVHFWHAPANAARLEIEALAFYEHYFHITQVAVGITGRYAAVLDMKPRLDAFKPKNDLGLVHHATYPTAHTSFHLLDTAGVELNYYTVLLALDDALGVVYYTHIGEGEKTTLTVLSYV
ncbi:hypothetical protein C8J57DRAFT_1673892 [Mycena rebaudengoi]|nr:hypothetical protein C8J57DRAFT_1673892 [Mycena rebaudengoi]